MIQLIEKSEGMGPYLYVLKYDVHITGEEPTRDNFCVFSCVNDMYDHKRHIDQNPYVFNVRFFLAVDRCKNVPFKDIIYPEPDEDTRA